LQDTLKKTKKYVISLSDFEEHFALPYAVTNHSVMGTTIDDEITIHNIEDIDAKWFWTAITRATSLKNVYFYLGEKFKCETPVSIIKNRLAHHKKYDVERRFYEEKKFVTLNWVTNELKRVSWMCGLCGNELTIQGKHQFSIDRMDNNIGHTVHNCRIICAHCNLGKH